MPKKKNQRTFYRTSGGQFIKNLSNSKDAKESDEFIESEATESSSEQDGEGEFTVEVYLNQESDWSTDTESGKGLGPVETRNEYQIKRVAAWKEKVRLESIQHAELMLDGPAHHADGHNSQLGTIRCPYKVGGLSLRTIQEKKKKLKDEAAASGGLISDEELAKQLENIDQQAKQASFSKQMTLTSFLKRP